MSINISDKINCCGCTACASICPKNCIELKPDELGFKYPNVDTELCVECGLCEKVCPFINVKDRADSYEKPYVYATRVKDETQLCKSQSGGAFYAFSEEFLDDAGVVYGACFDENLKVQHIRVTTKEEREKLRFSKYVQSDVEGIFASVKNDLKNGLKVLFVGTPCQVSGLKSYIGKKYAENLTVIDLVCHAVPSPKVWADYVNYIEKKYNSKITSALLRDKKFGWSKCYETFKLSSSKILTRRTYDDLYFSLYTVRESCSNCKFTNLNRAGDITIGDFWGWNKKRTEFNDDKGVSLVLLNTPKGKSLFERVKKNIYFMESDTTECLQPQLCYPIVLNSRRNEFIADYKNHGFEYVGKKYADLGLKSNIIKFLRKIKRRILK